LENEKFQVLAEEVRINNDLFFRFLVC